MLLLALACLTTSRCPAAQSLPLGAPDSWKYLAFDAGTKRVFIAHGNEITAVDTGSLRIVGHVPGLAGAHGVAIVPGGYGYAASSKTAAVIVFDPKTLQVKAVLKAGEDANSVTYDPISRHVFVANDDSGTVTIIDTATNTPVATVALPGGEGLEAAVADGSGHFFVNHSAQNNIVRIDTKTSMLDATWPLPGCMKPRGLALDAPLQRLFVSCDNSRLLVLDQRDGRLVATLPIGPASDSVLVDSLRHRIYTSNRDGTLSVIKVEGPDRYLPQRAVLTALAAHTAALDPATGIVYLVTAEVAGDAPAAAQRYALKPGTVRLLAIEPLVNITKAR